MCRGDIMRWLDATSHYINELKILDEFIMFN